MEEFLKIFTETIAKLNKDETSQLLQQLVIQIPLMFLKLNPDADLESLNDYLGIIKIRFKMVLAEK